jgi:catechol 2,3-dioxygenase-like lactoylglutathione lyase family enzyme
LDFDHITLKVPDPDATVDFLTEILGFSVSDEMRSQPDVLAAAWTRAGSQHDEIAMFKGPPEQTLHHYALRLESFDHLKRSADRLGAVGIQIETGPVQAAVHGQAAIHLAYTALGVAERAIEEFAHWTKVRVRAELTNQLFVDSGAMCLFQTSVMQQLWRDAHAASMHMVLGRGNALTSLGRTVMGLPGHPFSARHGPVSSPSPEKVCTTRAAIRARALI